MKFIKFSGDGGDDSLKGTVHAPGIDNGSDYTLCGVTLDWDCDTVGSWESTTKPINCARCIETIRLCKSIPASKISKGKHII